MEETMIYQFYEMKHFTEYQISVYVMIMMGF